jgi:hypothetical protein
MSLEVGDIVLFKMDDDFYGVVKSVLEPEKASKIKLHRYWVDWFDGDKPSWFYDYELIKVEIQQCQNITETKLSSREAKVIRRKSAS